MKILRAALLHTKPDASVPQGFALEYMEDAGLLIDGKGRIADKGRAEVIIERWPSVAVQDERPFLMMPGFIDSHLHFPQMDMIGVCAPSLLPWLHTYTFPEEIRFRGSDPENPKRADAFTLELAKQGTSFAVAYSSSDALATDQLFQAFETRGLRAIIGKVSMDQHGPRELLVPAAQDLKASEDLIAKWHQKYNRLFYALTPRFAPSCTPGLLSDLGHLLKSDATLYLQTHYAENKAEIEWVRQLYPKALDYLDVYDQFELLGARTILAHCIYMSPRERDLLLQRQSIVSHCPTSNLFLGSGLMPLSSYAEQGIKLSLGTDVGAGTSLSLWQTMNEAYKIAQLLQAPVTPEMLFYLATLGSAKALGQMHLGSLEKGYDADVQILDLGRKKSLERRWGRFPDSSGRISALIHGADDRNLVKLMVAGRDISLN